MKDINKILLLLILFLVDIDDFLDFIEIKANNIFERRELLKRVLTSAKYFQLLEGTYFLHSGIYSHMRRNVDRDLKSFSEFLITEKNTPFLIYCLRRYAYIKKHPISRYFTNELSDLFKSDCDDETAALR
ncbi:hypothetical protein [Pseudoflavitalea rhizosphaerae]|uniref:hypothetical protein n=1 Tax=Pseudoflavitalea rhizosphaerae TaxID=1884793 RepID=UPI000F8E054F|nr:hypothetical protein [Pseudoflavitalea rhizosphaerae]